MDYGIIMSLVWNSILYFIDILGSFLSLFECAISNFEQLFTYMKTWMTYDCHERTTWIKSNWGPFTHEKSHFQLVSVGEYYYYVVWKVLTCEQCVYTPKLKSPLILLFLYCVPGARLDTNEYKNSRTSAFRKKNHLDKSPFYVNDTTKLLA